MAKKIVLIIFLAAAAAALTWLAQTGGVRAAQQLGQALPEGISLHHDGARLTLYGDLRVTAPRLFGGSSDTPLLTARVLRISTPSPLAAIRWLIDPAQVPSAIRLRARGADTSALTALAPLNLLQGSGLVPFETLGCATLASLSPHDYRDMGRDPRDNVLQLDWQHEDDDKEMSITLHHAHAMLGDISLSAELVPTKRGGTLGIARLQLDHDDHGHLAWRNQTCAAAAGSTVEQWIQTHLNALSTTLAQADIRLSDQSLNLYRSHIQEGGQLRISLLPDADLEWQHWWIYPRTQLLRLLNITARHNDGPPIMLGMEFTEPQRVPAVVLDELDAVADGDSENWSPLLPHVVISRVAPDIGDNVMAAQADIGSEPNDAEKSAPLGGVGTTPRPRGRGLPASTVPPAAGSDAALVWNPNRFEALPDAGVAQLQIAIAITQLHRHQGARIRVLTESGRRIEGQVRGVDDDLLLLRVRRSSGHAELKIPMATIVEVQQLRGAATVMGD